MYIQTRCNILVMRWNIFIICVKLGYFLLIFEYCSFKPGTSFSRFSNLNIFLWSQNNFLVKLEHCLSNMEHLFLLKLEHFLMKLPRHLPYLIHSFLPFSLKYANLYIYFVFWICSSCRTSLVLFSWANIFFQQYRALYTIFSFSLNYNIA